MANLGSQRLKENHQYLAHDTGFHPNVDKFLTLVKVTIISEVNLKNLQFKPGFHMSGKSETDREFYFLPTIPDFADIPDIC